MKRLKLHRKVQLALVFLSLIPLVILAVNSIITLRKSETFLLHKSTETIDRQIKNNLELRATMVSRNVSDFLNSVVGDLHDLASLPATVDNYRSFHQRHQRTTLSCQQPQQTPALTREAAALYSELTFIDQCGQEQVRIVAGLASSELRDVSISANTTYKQENYFTRTQSLPKGEIYVSHLTGWHTSNHSSDPKYSGVIRFATNVFDRNGAKLGMVVLSLDHCHLMEFTQHINPTTIDGESFPSYDSGNYAFMFDDQGWMITHPKQWDIRGVNEQGEWLAPYSATSTAEQIQQRRIPFNLDSAGFIHPNYPVVANAVRNRDHGVVDVTNVGGSHKIMAYAPIEFNYGDYRSSGIFGGITIGAELNDFHQPALDASLAIRFEFSQYIATNWLIILLTAILVLFSAWVLSINMTQPILDLIEGTKRMADGEQDVRVMVSSSDEIGDLALAFNTMVAQLGKRSDKLIHTLDDLRRSQHDILQARNFNNAIIESMETGLMTLNESAEVLSINSAARRVLAIQPAQRGSELKQVLDLWPELYNAIISAINHELQDTAQPWNRYIEVDRQGVHRTIRLAIFPLNQQSQRGHIVTIEDLTKRVNQRKQMARMERLAALGKFSAGIAHEVRNPLTGISLLLDELHDRLLSSPKDQNLIRKALDEIERLDNLVNELLHYTTSSVNRSERSSLQPIVQQSLATIARQCEQGGIKISQFNFGEQIELLLDPYKIHQALLNLYTNALQAMPEGGELSVTLEQSSEGAHLTIRDTGTGISAERLPMIFEPFHTNRGEGTGLGLSITYNIITEHDGTIEVSSIEHQGTTFTLFLPTQPAAARFPV